MNIREATREDNAALCALEKRTPLNLGDNPIWLDRTNFFALHDLQEQTVVMVAEENSEIVGACAGALNHAPIDGKEHLLLYLHHERIDLAHQRSGIGGALTRAVADYWQGRESGEIDSSYWFIAPANSQSRSFAERSGNKPWPVSAWIATFDARPTGLDRPKQVGAGPIFDIVRLINLTHEGEDLFRPYQQVDFGRRLARSGEYGWGDVYGRLSDGALVAVAGVWDRGASTTIHSHTGANGTRGWWIADYGCERGAEDQMAMLLESLCAKAADSGRDTVSVAVCPDSALYGALARLPHTLSEQLLYIPRLDPPAVPKPVYLDPVYF